MNGETNAVHTVREKLCASSRGVKIYLYSCKWVPVPEPEQNFAGTCAAKKVKADKLDVTQKYNDKVICEGSVLKNVFKYLGSIFTINGDQISSQLDTRMG